MDLGDIFKHFMGISPNRPRPPFNGDEMGDERDSDIPEFNHDMGDVMNEMDQMFQSIDEVFSNMGFGRIPRGNRHEGFSFEMPGENHDAQRKAPRDHMLKEPGTLDRLPPPERRLDSFPRYHPIIHEKRDTDFDEDTSRGDLGSLFGNHKGKSEIEPQPRTYFKSVTIKTVRTPDGKIQQEKIVRDGTGKEETTVTTTEPSPDDRVLGDFQNFPSKDTGQLGGGWNLRNIFGHDRMIKDADQDLKPLKENPDQNKNSIFRRVFDALFGDKKSR